MAQLSFLKAARSDRLLIIVEAAVALAILAAVVGKSYGAFSTILFVVCALAFAATAMFLFRMVTSLNDERLEIIEEPLDEIRESLLREKKLLTEGIKELEIDHAAGKVDNVDYQILRQTAEARALEVIKRLKNQEAHWMKAARKAVGLAEEPPINSQNLIPQRPMPNTPLADTRVFNHEEVTFIEHRCDACKTKNPPDAIYCIGCGRPSEAAMS